MILVFNVSFLLFYVNQVENKLCMLDPVIYDKDILHTYIYIYTILRQVFSAGESLAKRR